jgi:proliferating cell nuclear antigen
MFQVKCKAEVLRNIIESISSLVDEVKFHITPEGLSLKAVDPAHVAMVELTLKKAAFEEYKADEMDIGVDMEKLRDVLKLAGAEDEITLKHEDASNRLVIKIGNLTRSMSLVDTNGMTDPKVPKLDLPASVMIAASELERGIKASEAVSDHIAFIITPDHFELQAQGDTDVVNMRLEKDSLSHLRCKDKVKSLFSLDYLANMIKAAKGSPGIDMNLGSDYPVRMEFDIAGGNGHVTYLLAPRIESE